MVLQVRLVLQALLVRLAQQVLQALQARLVLLVLRGP